MSVDAGYLVSHSVSLAPCAAGPKAPPPSSRQGFAPWLERLLSIPSAYAGHGGPADPSAISVPHIESLRSPETLDLGEVSFPAAAYCKVHYLIARADGRARELPRDVDLLGTSLHLAGSVKPPGGAGEAPLAVHTSLANGALRDIPVETRGDPATAARASITVRRELDRIFDGIDFSTASAPSVERRILTNLVNHTSVHVHLEPPER